MLFVAQRIHRLPETLVAIGDQFAAGSEPLQWGLLPRRLGAVDQIENRRIGDEEAAIDETAIAVGLFLERANAVAVKFKGSKSTGRLDGRNRRFLAMTTMEIDQGRDVDRGYAVTVSEAEGLCRVDIVADRLQPAAGLGVRPGFHQGDPPRLAPVLVDFQRVLLEVDRDVGGVQEVIGEIFLDQITLVAKADDEIVHPVGRIDFHDVPKYRHTADLDHRLRTHRRFLAEPRPEASCQNNRLHRLRPPLLP